MHYFPFSVNKFQTGDQLMNVSLSISTIKVSLFAMHSYTIHYE